MNLGKRQKTSVENMGFLYLLSINGSKSIENNGLFLFIDLYEDSINLRYNHNEFYIFINEIALEELKMLLENFFEGKYLIKSFVNKDFIVKQELIFTNQYLKKYNQVDLYSNKKIDTIFEKEGYNWIEGSVK